MKRIAILTSALLSYFRVGIKNDLYSQIPIAPSIDELNLSFNNNDIVKFKDPPKVFYPEIWFHFYGGNISKPGNKANIDAISQAGFSGLQLFHKQHEKSKPWPGVHPQIAGLSKEWVDLV
jgi:hypothetical protein